MVAAARSGGEDGEGSSEGKAAMAARAFMRLGFGGGASEDRGECGVRLGFGGGERNGCVCSQGRIRSTMRDIGLGAIDGSDRFLV
jgi:hypothetical protein